MEKLESVRGAVVAWRRVAYVNSSPMTGTDPSGLNHSVLARSPALPAFNPHPLKTETLQFARWHCGISCPMRFQGGDPCGFTSGGGMGISEEAACSSARRDAEFNAFYDTVSVCYADCNVGACSCSQGAVETSSGKILREILNENIIFQIRENFFAFFFCRPEFPIPVQLY